MDAVRWVARTSSIAAVASASSWVVSFGGSRRSQWPEIERSRSIDAVLVDAEALGDELPWLGADDDIGGTARAAGVVELLFELDQQTSGPGEGCHLQLKIDVPQADGP
jgi:hypothetical protein